MQHSSQNSHEILELFHATQLCPYLQCQQGEEQYSNGGQSFLVVLQSQQCDYKGKEILGGEEVGGEEAYDNQHVDEALD